MGGLIVAVFAGWIMCSDSSSDELDPAEGYIYRAWRLLTRFVAPAAVLIVFLHAIGVFE
ncbi:MAG: hypothetical protein QF897_00795 [Gammaproteobacteria bacterium]|nr:hypothetical protein [Gammaproteobacteria bacterium]